MTSSLVVEVLATQRGGEFTATRRRRVARYEEPFFIGSRPGPGPALVLADATVSPRHAEVFARDGTWSIRDLHSDNGIVLFRGPTDLDGPAFPEGVARDHVQEAAVCSPLLVAVGAVLLRLRTTAADEAASLSAAAAVGV